EMKLSETRMPASCPTPALQPRFKLWPEAVNVDHSGISLVMGVVIAQPGILASPRPVHRIEREPVDVAAVPVRRGMTLGLSSALLEGMTASAIDVGAAEIHANEVPIKEFDALEEIGSITKAVPDLARYGDKLRVRTRLRSIQPVKLSQAENTNSDSAAKPGD